ncbi:MAG: DUF2608 domain-containing protein [Endomicrobium sp.]|jgi:hypothetical protein|nr:DUF2608 domain-containing protein [Endomicrobium sp.]
MKLVKYLFLCFLILTSLSTYTTAKQSPKTEIVKSSSWEKAIKSITSRVLQSNSQKNIICITDDDGILLDSQLKAIPKSYNLFYFMKYRKIPIFCLATIATAEKLKEEGFRFNTISASVEDNSKFSITDGVIRGQINDNKIPGLVLFLEKTNFTPDQIIFIDDSYKNIEDMIDFCKNSGIDCFAINLVLK